jgi:tRNA (guanine37-N1)-methyltransferase
MIIDIITLFPDLFKDFLNTKNLKTAVDLKKLTINLIDLKNYGIGDYRSVDGKIFGGEPGMILRVDVLHSAIESCKRDNQKVILLSPSGTLLDQNILKEFKMKDENLIIICGHYEGYDARIENYIDLKISIGEFVLSGGELPAMIILDGLTRILDDVINVSSYESDTFYEDNIKYPVYTKPISFLGNEVPEILRSGNHNLIKKYNQEKSQELTLKWKKSKEK